MKPLLLFTLSVFFIISCRKNIVSENTTSSYLENVKKSLADSLTNSDFANLDLSSAIITPRDSLENYLRIPFKGIKISNEFVLLKTNPNGRILQGSIIYLKRDAVEKNTRQVYNGVIKISFLNRSEKLKSAIKNGYVIVFHPKNTALRSLVVPTESNVLPEIVVTCYVKEGGISYSNWMNISGLSGGGYNGYYSSMEGYGGGGGGSNVNGGNNYAGFNGP